MELFAGKKMSKKATKKRASKPKKASRKVAGKKKASRKMSKKASRKMSKKHSKKGAGIFGDIGHALDIASSFVGLGKKKRTMKKKSKKMSKKVGRGELEAGKKMSKKASKKRVFKTKKASRKIAGKKRASRKMSKKHSKKMSKKVGHGRKLIAGNYTKDDVADLKKDVRILKTELNRATTKKMKDLVDLYKSQDVDAKKINKLKGESKKQFDLDLNAELLKSEIQVLKEAIEFMNSRVNF